VKTAAVETDVMFIDELCTRLAVSRQTVDRRLKAGTFQPRPLPRIDDRWRWSRRRVAEFLATAEAGGPTRHRRPRRAAQQVG
jgi:hypothetical protein